MMSSSRNTYSSASEWLSFLKQDEAWLSQLQRLQASADSNTSTCRDDMMRLIGNGDTFALWEIYQHKVEPVVAEVWEIAELSLPKLKIQTIGMLSMEWLEQQPEKVSKVKVLKKQKSFQTDKPQKPRETMTFKRKSNVLDGHLTLLFDKLTNLDERFWQGHASRAFQADDCRKAHQCTRRVYASCHPRRSFHGHSGQLAYRS